MHNSKKSSNFAVPFEGNREVAQLVAHYVRDVGVGCSSHLFSTKRMVIRPSFLSSRDSNTRVLSPSGTIIAGRQCSSHPIPVRGGEQKKTPMASQSRESHKNLTHSIYLKDLGCAKVLLIFHIRKSFLLVLL